MCDKNKINDECEEFEQDIDLDTTFTFPQNMTEHNVLGKYLIIAPEQANWLVCDDEEYAVFCLFREGKSIQEVEELLEKHQQMNADHARVVVSRLIAQILGKEFQQKDAVIEKKAFRVASLFLTAGCNLRCSTCLFKATVAGPNECSFHDWNRFLEVFSNMGGETVTLTGGEPMTNPDFAKIVTCAKGLGLRVVVLTNGTLVTKEIAQFLGNNCDEIQVSIDGPKAETHDSVRGEGGFEKAISALRELSAYPRCHLSIAMTPTLATLPVFQTELHRFAEWVWENIGPDVSLRVTQKLAEGRDIASLSNEEQIAFRKNVIALCDDQLEVDFVDKLDAATIVPNRRASGCGVAEFFSVMANGDIKMCEFFPNSFGNIKDIEEDSALISDIAEKVGEIARSLRVEELPTCRQCDLRYFCGGKCRADNRLASGNPKVFECDDVYKNTWYERLVHISSYIVEPVTDLKGGETNEKDQDQVAQASLEEANSPWPRIGLLLDRPRQNGGVRL